MVQREITIAATMRICGSPRWSFVGLTRTGFKMIGGSGVEPVRVVCKVNTS
jgi:hypothetical protein